MSDKIFQKYNLGGRTAAERKELEFSEIEISDTKKHIID
jgi:hypothetical protein